MPFPRCFGGFLTASCWFGAFGASFSSSPGVAVPQPLLGGGRINFLGAGHEINHFAFGECGNAQNERGGLYITHVCDGGKAKPTVVIGEVIGYIIFTVSTTKSQRFYW